MDEVSERCVLLKNLPPSCNEKVIREILDLAHDNFRFQDKYDKIHKHVELRDDIRWIVLFRTRKDAVECIRSGPWECSVPGGSCVVKPDYCSGCIIPDEWLQSTACADNSDESWTVYSDDLEEGTLNSEDLFSSFVDVKRKTHKTEDPVMGTSCYSNKQGRKVRTSDSETEKYENKFDDLLTELSPSGNENDDNEDEKAKTSGSRNSSFSEGNISSSELFGSGRGKKDKIKPFSDSVRSSDLFGSGHGEFESMQFSYNKDIDNADKEEMNVSKRHQAQKKADSIENPELFGCGKGDVKPISTSVMSTEMFGSGKNEKESSYNVKPEKDKTTETKDSKDQNHTEANVDSIEKSTDFTKQQINATESEGENITRCLVQYDRFATGKDLENEDKNDQQNMDGIISQDQRQINTVPKPEDNSSKTQHNQTYSSNEIENQNTSSNYATIPVNERNSAIQDCKVTEKNDVKAENMKTFNSPDNHGTSDNRSSVMYDVPPIQRMHVITSSTKSSSANQIPNSNDAQNRVYDVPPPQTYHQYPPPHGYTQYPGYFNTAAYHERPPPGMQPYMPYHFNPNANFRFPYPGYQAMQPIPQLPGFYPPSYPMVPPGVQAHGTMPQVYFVPMYLPHPGTPGALPPSPTVNNPEYSEIKEESTCDAAVEKANKNSEKSQEELTKPSKNQENELKGLDGGSKINRDSPAELPKPVSRQSSLNEHKVDGAVYDTPYAATSQTSASQQGNFVNPGNSHGPEYNIPKKGDMKTSDAIEPREQEQKVSTVTVTDSTGMWKNRKGFDGNRSEHVYYEIDDISVTLNDDNGALGNGGSGKVYDRTEEPDKSAERLNTTPRLSRDRALPPVPATSTLDYSTVVKKRHASSDSKSIMGNDDKEVIKEEVGDEGETGRGLPGRNRIILVKGLSDEITKDALELYFETRRIGGGDIEFSEIDGKKRQAIVAYKSERDAKEVVRRATKGQTFNLYGCNLEVLEYHPPTMDPLKVFVQNIAATTTDECITNFIEGRCRLSSKVLSVIRGETPGTAMLCFAKPPDVQQIQTICETKKCEGNIWKITPVERTRSIQVTCLSPQTTSDSLSLYFENKRRSLGGEVESVLFRPDRKDCIVTFVEAEDAERTFQMTKHVVDGQTIQVRLHYACLELDENFIVVIPSPILCEEVDEYVRKFLKNSTKYRSMIENGIASFSGRVIWDSQNGENTCIQIECTVDPKDKHGLKKVKDWTENCTQTLKDVIDTLIVQSSQNIAMEVWPELKIRLREISVPDPQQVAVILTDSEGVVVVVGEKQSVRSVFDQIKRIVDDVEDKLKKENKVITKKLRFKKYEFLLLRASKIEYKLKKDLEEFSMDYDSAEVALKGKQKDVDMAATKLRSRLRSFASKPVPGFTKEAKDLLFKKGTRNYIKAKMIKEKIIGVWDVPRGYEVVMHSNTAKDVDKAIQIIQDLVKTDSIQIDLGVVQSEELAVKLRELITSHEGFFLYSLQQDELRFVCVDHIYDEVKNSIVSFLDLNTIISQFVPMDDGTYSFIRQYKDKEVASIENQYSRLAVRVEIIGKEPKRGFKVRGKKDGCRLAINKLQRLIDSVARKDHKLAWPGFDKFLKSSEGIDAMKGIELLEKCVLKVSFEDSRTHQTHRKDSQESSRHTVVDQSQSPIKKHVVIGSIATEKVDVIVNSTNTYVDMNVGAVSQTLLKGGGEQLGLECKTKYPKGINVGEIAVTSGGTLNCQRLFHGVLVKWDDGEGHAEKVMAHFVKKCLDLAHTNKYGSIAFPALGTGMLKFPADVVARLMNDVVDDFGAVYSDTSLKTVKFVIWQGDKATAKAFEDLTVTRRQRPHSTDKSKERYSTMAAENIVEKEGNLQTTIGKVSINVSKDDITQAVVGAIVNSTTDDLNLNSGAISKAILIGAGSSIQTEATRKKAEFDAEDLVVTGPGKLLCQKIIHVRARNGLNGWTKTIQKCLIVTESLGLSSVAFPALGTGGKGVPADQMAKTMIEAFRDFIKSPKYTGCLSSIYIVIFDSKMLDTFVAVIKASLYPQPRKSLVQEMKFWDRKPNVEMAPHTTVHIYGDSSHYLDRAVSKIEELRKEKELFVSIVVLDNLSDYAMDLQRIGYGKDVKIVIGSGKVKVMGYGKAFDIAVDDAQKFLDHIAKDIRDKQLSSTIMLPASWKGMKVSDKTQVVKLSTKDPEYIKISRNLSSSVTQIISIDRIQNPTLYTQYIGKKRQMELINAGGRQVEQQLWHGTRTRQAVDNIIQKGFDRNYNSGSAHGVGVYFAPAVRTSLGYCSPDPNTGENYILLADVLTGEYCAVTGAIRVPPLRTRTLTYDSTTDSVQSPSMFVIYHDAQAYPTYMITFR